MLSAYPYVRLHQPSAYYGVNLRRLGNDSIDASGWNEGFWKPQAAARSSRTTTRSCDSTCCRRVACSTSHERLSGRQALSHPGRWNEYRVEVTRRVVDATYLSVVVPSMRPPAYEVSPDVVCIPPTVGPPGRSRAAPSSSVRARRRWTRARGCCATTSHPSGSPGSESASRGSSIAAPCNRDRSSLAACSPTSPRSRGPSRRRPRSTICTFSEKLGCLMRIDQSIEPTMYRCAILSQFELEKLRTITDVVRMGYVQSIAPGLVTLRARRRRDRGRHPVRRLHRRRHRTEAPDSRLLPRRHHAAVGAHLPAGVQRRRHRPRRSDGRRRRRAQRVLPAIRN